MAHQKMLPNAEQKQQQQQRDQPRSHNSPNLVSSSETLANLESETSSASTEIKPVPAWRLHMVTVALMVGFFLALLDTSIVATAIYSISVEFGSLSTTFWVVLAYTLSYVSFASVFARISDFTGRRAGIMLAFVLFIATSLGCGWSKSLNGLIAARALQGIGGAGLFDLALAVILEIHPPQKRAQLSGIVGMTIAVSGACAPLIGGAFAQHVTWRWIFWLNGPLGLTGLFVFYVGWHEQFELHKERRSWREFDWIGTLLIMAASILVVQGLQQPAEGQIAWNSAHAISTLTVGCTCWMMLFIYQFSIRKTKLAAAFPFVLMRNRALTSAYIATLLAGFTAFAAIYVITLRFQLVNGQSPSEAGIKLLPFLFASAFGSFIGAKANETRNNFFASFTMATCFILLGLGLCSTWDASTHIAARNYGFQVILGFGNGMAASTISLMSSMEAAPADHAVAQGISGQMRILGSSIGVAAFNGILSRQRTRGLLGKLPPTELSAVTVNVAAVNQLSPQQQGLVRDVYSDAFNQWFRIGTYIAAFGIIAALCTWQKDPPHFSKTVDKPLEDDKELKIKSWLGSSGNLSFSDCDMENGWADAVLRAFDEVARPEKVAHPEGLKRNMSIE